jgi:ribosome-binding protein aMBF1 (putative translation factor)
MGAQFIKTPNGEDLAVLPRSEYEALVHALQEAEEDLADVAAHDAARADPHGSEQLPVEVSQFITKGAGLVKALRLWRGLAQGELATRAGLSQGFLSDLENRRRKRTDDVSRRLAKALNVPEGWLV